MKHIRWTAMVLSVILLGGWGAAGEKSNAKQLVGTWRIASIVHAGKEAPSEVTSLARLTFAKDGKTHMSLGSKEVEGKYKIITAGQIDLALDPRQDLAAAIYKFDGRDKLLICLDPSGKKRPTAFSGDAESRNVLMTLTRAKAGEEKLTKEELAKNAGLLGKIDGAAARANSSNNLKQIALAMHGYSDTFKAFPLQAIYSKDGKTPLLSWRVAILPYVEQIELFNQFKLDEPWDSDHNKKLIERMPKLYAIEGTGAGKGKTHYQLITGPGTPFDGNKKINFRNLGRGSSNTILAVEAKEPVIWSKPADLTLPKEKNKLPALGVRKDGVLAVMFDGSVRTYRVDENPAELRAMMLLK